MVKVTGPTNPILRKEIRYLYKCYKTYGAPIWRAVAEKLSTKKRNRVAVNLFKINRLTSANEMVVVPGKVLGFGFLDHPVIIAAYAFSSSARNKITEAGGKPISLREMVELNPKGTNVKIIV